MNNGFWLHYLYRLFRRHLLLLQLSPNRKTLLLENDLQLARMAADASGGQASGAVAVGYSITNADSILH